jgi:putative ABC transport system permease protein
VHELFGIPLGTLVVVLGVALVAALGALGLLALRNPVLLRLGVRNVARRRGRTVLIVAGLMLGTAIIGAALTAGDTMSNTIRSSAIATLGNTDEVVARKGALQGALGELGGTTGLPFFDASAVASVDAALGRSGLADGIAPAISEQVAVQAPAQRTNEPRVTVFATDPARIGAFGKIDSASRGAVFLSDLHAGEVYLNEHAAGELGVAANDEITVFAAASPVNLRVRDVVRYDGAGTDGSALLVPLATAQQLLGRPGQINSVLVSNRGGTTSGVPLTDEVVRTLTPALAPLGLEAGPTKQDALKDADAAGSAFMAFFTTFGSFSISAGILLIFLIFVMLAAERRSELGIARAIGTRRSHLVEMFTFEGAAYDLAAAVVGALLGAALAYGMVLVMATALSAETTGRVDIHYAVSVRSLVVAYALGVLITLAVVAFSAWRVSVMTISTAIRNLPEPVHLHRRRRLALGLAGIALGLLLAVAGASSSQASPLMLGVSVVLISLVPILRLLGGRERIAFTVPGFLMLVLLMLPWGLWEDVFGPLSMDFTTWIGVGLMIVVGAVWTIMYNADLLIGLVMRVLGRVRALVPILRISMAYPLAGRFRTGVTLAMFTLVVFTLVTGSTASNSFNHAFASTELYGGGFDVRATTSLATPITDMRAALAAAPGIRRSDFEVSASQSMVPLEARQLGTGRPFEQYPVRGLDDAFLSNTTFELGAVARGYASARSVWRALERNPGLAVVDSFIVPRRDNFSFAPFPSEFELTGFYYDDGTFDPIPIQVRDSQTGRSARLTVVGVLADTAPLDMLGISTSQRTLGTAFPGRAQPTIHYFRLAPGVDRSRAAAQLESAFLASGMEADRASWPSASWSAWPRSA